MDGRVSYYNVLLYVILGLFTLVYSQQEFANETNAIKRTVTTFTDATTVHLLSFTEQVDLTTEPMYEEWGTPKVMNALPTFEDVDEHLAKSDAVAFLSLFENDVQREVVREQLRSCPLTDLCGFSLNVPMHQGINRVACCLQCSCYFPFCLSDDTCCPDIIPAFYFEDVYRNTSLETQKKKRCTITHAKYDYYFKLYALPMYSTCPRNTDSYLNGKCSDVYTYESSTLADMLPATTMDDGIYRNKYCALCQGVAEDDLQFWSAKLNCLDTVEFSMQSEDEILRQVFKSNTCDITFAVFGTVSLSTCTPTINTCNVTGLWDKYDPVLEFKCHLYYSVYYRKLGYDFQNVFCLQCNGFNVTSTTCLEINKAGGSDSFAFSGLLRLQGLQSLSTLNDKADVSRDSQCISGNQMYDEITVSILWIEGK